MLTHLFSRRLVIVGMLLATLVIGCGPIAKRRTKEERQAAKLEKIAAEAYLYDVKIFQQGKKTSVRLEIYLTDSIAGISAKGYLGKGALKGWLTEDSIMVFFPTVDEYLYEAVETLLSSSKCVESSTEVDFLSIFSSYPGGIQIRPDTTISGRPSFFLSDSNCPWRLDLEYDNRKVGPRLRKFVFDDGGGNRFEGKRRKFKPNGKVPTGRFELTIPASSRRITR